MKKSGLPNRGSLYFIQQRSTFKLLGGLTQIQPGYVDRELSLKQRAGTLKMTKLQEKRQTDP